MMSLCSADQEVCGYILPDGNCGGSVHLVTNIASDPANYFEMDNWSVRHLCITIPDNDLVFWHSHPVSRPIPSKEDIDFIQRTARPHVIIGFRPFPMICLYGFEGKRIVQLEKVKEEKSC